MGYIGYVTSSNIASYPFASLGDYIFHNAFHTVGLYVIQSGDHDEKNFSIGDSCAGTYLSNHATDGRLKYKYGGSGNYSGPIGNRVWLYYPDTTATVSNSGGDALFTSVGHGLSTGYYVMVKGYQHYGQLNVPYSGYYYVEAISDDTFKLRISGGTSFIPYSGVATVPYSLTIGSSKMEGIDAHGSSNNPVVISNAPGSQAIFRKNWSDTNNYGFQIFNGGSHVKITGEYSPDLHTGDENYQGHRGGYKYSTGRYGLFFQFYNLLTNNSILQIGDGSTNYEVSFVEVDGGNRGFAGLMLKTDNQPTLDMHLMNVHDCYIHDTDGEGTYDGNTSDNTPPTESQHWVDLWFYNNRLARTGVEMLQTGQLHNTSIVENNVAYLGSLTHMAPFFLGQSNAQQFKPRTSAISRNNVVIGGTANLLLLQSNNADETPDGTEIEISNTAYHHGRQRFMYYGSMDGISPLRLSKLYLKSITPYDSDRNESQATDYNEVILTTDVTNNILINGMHLDNNMSGKTTIVRDGITSLMNFSDVRREAVPDVLFVKSGFEGIAPLDIHYWEDRYNAGHPDYPNQLIIYTPKDYVFDRGLFYKCITIHSGTTKPADSINWTQIFWDENGFNSQHPSYNGVAYSVKPPDDLRLQGNTFYNEQGIGLFDNLSNTNKTYITWDYCYSVTGSTYNLPVLPAKNISTSEVQRKVGSCFVRRNITGVNSIGTGLKSTSDWVAV